MLRRRPGRPSGGDTSSRQHEIAFVAGANSSAVASPPPKLLLASSGEVLVEAVVMSPTSILQTAAVSPSSPADTCGGGGTAVPFSRTGGGVCSVERRSKSHRRPWDAKPVGLGLVGALNRDAPDDVACASAVVTGQIKLCSAPSKELGAVKSSRTGTAAAPARHASPRPRCPSPGEMEASEDYTRVIARGANPRTTHIFDNRVVDTRGCFWFPEERAAAASGGTDYFLRRCHGCSKELGQGKDIFMYRGERAFCSRECRHREMLFDNGDEL